MNSINHQIRLAARPSGLPAPSDWELTTEPVPAPGPGEFVTAVSYLSIDPAMRRWIGRRLPVLRRAGPDRRGDGSWRDRAGDCLGAAGVHGRGSRVRRVRGPGLRVLRRHRRHEARPAAGAATDLSRGARRDWPDRVLRAARYWPPERGRHGGRLGCGRGRRELRRADRQDQGMPGDRSRGRAGEVPLDCRGPGFRCGHRLQGSGRRSRRSRPAARPITWR